MAAKNERTGQTKRTRGQAVRAPLPVWHPSRERPKRVKLRNEATDEIVKSTDNEHAAYKILFFEIKNKATKPSAFIQFRRTGRGIYE
jgi:hypothetical protein